MVPKVKDLYKEKVAISLKEQFLYSNVMEIPRLQRIVLNIGLGRLSDGGKDMKVIEDTANELSLITGQRAVITRARKSIAGFKLREGVPIGCMVTLRGNKMYEFFDRLVNIALPRVRDFRGFSSNSFDGEGNYTFGIKDLGLPQRGHLFLARTLYFGNLFDFSINAFRVILLLS